MTSRPEEFNAAKCPLQLTKMEEKKTLSVAWVGDHDEFWGAPGLQQHHPQFRRYLDSTAQFSSRISEDFPYSLTFFSSDCPT